MKRKREGDRPFFSHVSYEALEPSLSTYIGSKIVQTAEYNHAEETYKVLKYGHMISCGGIHKALYNRFYKHYKFNRSKRNWKTTDIKGSTKATGIRVDGEMVRYIENPSNKGFHAYSVAVLNYLTKHLGHTPQVAQLPVELFNWMAMTQCDFITRDSQGLLHAWEIKTGAPVGGYHEQGVFANLRDGEGNPIKCTGYTIWQLQLHFTTKALKEAGVNISESHIIQVFESRKKGLQLKVHDPEPWTNHLNSLIFQ